MASNSFRSIAMAMSKVVDNVFDQLTSETSGVAVFVDNELENLKKKRIVKRRTGDVQELTVCHSRSAKPSKSKTMTRMRELRKDPGYRTHENNRRRLRRI